MRTLIPLLLGLLSSPVLSAAERDASDTLLPQQMTAAQLQLYCAASAMSATGLQRRRYCEGFLSGLEEGVRVLGQQAVPPLCMPVNVSARQMRADFIRASAAVKPMPDKPAAVFAFEVLRKSYPCR